MSEDLMPFDMPRNQSSIIKVLGVGGGGSNAVNHMFRQGIKDVDFIICNTDAQALEHSPVPIKIQLGATLTEGRGAGNKPEIGREAAIESLSDVMKILTHNTKMIFITAGMGGGTGTGAAPVIAKAAKELGILTIGIVTIPFRFEGARRIDQAVEGINLLSGFVDSLLVINNEKVREIWGDLPVTSAFAKADNVLTIAAKGIAEIITLPGHINVDFADVKTVMADSGVALMGSASAVGPDRAITAIKEALSSPLLNNNGINGAQDILLNISAGKDEATMDEITQINEFVQEAAGNNANIIWGCKIDPTMGENLCVTVIATGFETDIIPEIYLKGKRHKDTVAAEAKAVPTVTTDGFFTVINRQGSKPAVTTVQDKQPQGQIRKESYVPPLAEDKFEIEENLPDEFVVKTVPKPGQERVQQPNNERNRNSNTYQEKSQNSNYNFNPTKYADNIEDIEKIPAYLRQNKNISNDAGSTNKNISKIPLIDNDDTQARN